MSDWTCRDCGRAGDDCSLKAIFSSEDTYYVCIGGWASECKDSVIAHQKRVNDNLRTLIEADIEIKKLAMKRKSEDYVRIAGENADMRKDAGEALQCLERYLTEQDEQFIMDAIGILKGD